MWTGSAGEVYDPVDHRTCTQDAGLGRLSVERATRLPALELVNVPAVRSSALIFAFGSRPQIHDRAGNLLRLCCSAFRMAATSTGIPRC